LTIGLTGACCSGKSAVADILAEKGWHCIDVDKLGHQALEQVLPAVCELLGRRAAGADGIADRRFIASQVFAAPGLLKQYEALVHPAMFKLVDAQIAAAAKRQQPACINAAILYRMPQAKQCDWILEVQASLAKRLARARKRDKLPWATIMDRMRRQSAILELRDRYSGKLLFVRNNGSLDQLREALVWLEHAAAP